MVHAPVIPDSEIVLVLPSVPDLQVVVIDEQSHEPVEQRSALQISDIVHLRNVLADGEHALPASDGVGADDGVDGLEKLANVLGSTALAAVDLEAVLFGGLVEARLRVGCGQAFEEFLVWCRDAVVQLISRGPQGVYDFISFPLCWGYSV